LPYQYLLSATLARLADEGARVALVLHALERTSSAAFGGILIAAFMLPHVLAAPGVGALADRTRRRRLVHASAPLIFAASLAFVALGLGRIPEVAVLTAALVGGCATPLIMGGLTGLIRDLVPESGRTRVYALDAATYDCAGICGPPLAAGLASAFAPSTATLCLTACAAMAAALLAGLPVKQRSFTAEAGASIWSGIEVIWCNTTLRAVTVGASVGMLGVGALPVIATLLAVQNAAPAAAGVLLSASAIGSLCGSLLYARWPISSTRPERVVMAGLTLGALPMALAAFVDFGPLAAVLFGLNGLVGGPTTIAQFSTRDSAAPRHANTQLFALAAGLKITAAAFGAVLGGQLAGLGPRDLLLLVAGCDIAGALVGTALLGRRIT
jgi:MFS family permease